jgi:hypothetical protein
MTLLSSSLDKTMTSVVEPAMLSSFGEFSSVQFLPTGSANTAYCLGKFSCAGQVVEPIDNYRKPQIAAVTLATGLASELAQRCR